MHNCCAIKFFGLVLATIFIAKIDAEPISVVLDDMNYLISHDEKLNWWAARTFCRENNMQLITLENADKLKTLNDYLESQDFIDKPEIGTDYIYWTLGNDLKSEGTFVWDYGGPKFIYTNWLEGMPDNWRGDEHCVEMGFLELGKWNDNRCRYHRHFICERKLNEGVQAV